jgi:Fe2+ or Zn2+ uptake regulation protein
MSEPSIEASLKDLERRCRASGMPWTVQRRAILAALLARSDHPTADVLYADTAKTLPGVSRGG